MKSSAMKSLSKKQFLLKYFLPHELGKNLEYRRLFSFTSNKTLKKQLSVVYKSFFFCTSGSKYEYSLFIFSNALGDIKDVYFIKQQ